MVFMNCKKSEENIWGQEQDDILMKLLQSEGVVVMEKELVSIHNKIN